MMYPDGSMQMPLLSLAEVERTGHDKRSYPIINRVRALELLLSIATIRK